MPKYGHKASNCKTKSNLKEIATIVGDKDTKQLIVGRKNKIKTDA